MEVNTDFFFFFPLHSYFFRATVFPPVFAPVRQGPYADIGGSFFDLARVPKSQFSTFFFVGLRGGLTFDHERSFPFVSISSLPEEEAKPQSSRAAI